MFPSVRCRGGSELHLEAGSCRGQSATIVGGGPSLKGFNFSSLASRQNIIVINAAFRYVPFADACFSEDIRFIEQFKNGLLLFKGQVIWHCLRGTDPERGLKAVPGMAIVRETRDDKYWSKDLHSLSFSSNSVVGAINLAEILGCDPIYLLGVDCRAEGSVMTNFHHEYPQGWEVGAIQAINWKSDFENWVAPNCKAKIVNVINPACESTLECWPKITLQEFIQ
jgi:hypothetical protein